MQFIGTGDRILTENFVIGYLYTITFKTGIYSNSACIGIGDNFVMFQRAEPDLLFNLNVNTADEVDTIELYDSGGGTNDYEDLSNKPQINSHTLTGNMSGTDLGLQNTISDLDTIRAGAAAGATAVQPADMTTALAAKQDALTTAQLSAVNSGITSADVAQITTNKNNISLQQDTVAQGGNGYAIINGQRLYMSDTAPSGTIPVGSALVSNGKVWGYKASNVANPTILSDGTSISDYTIKGNAEQNGTPTPSSPVDVTGVGTLDNSNYVIPVTSGGATTNVPIGTVQTTRAIKKIVFDGTENYWRITGSGRMAYPLTDLPQRLTIPLCSHFIGSTAESYGGINNGECSISVTNQSIREFGLYDSSITALADFKVWLATQYANGTPLTLWYVLATAETAAVNEPLVKIGSYADSVTGTQSLVSIPTTAGENAINFGTTVQPSEFDITAWV